MGWKVNQHKLYVDNGFTLSIWTAVSQLLEKSFLAVPVYK